MLLAELEKIGQMWTTTADRVKKKHAAVLKELENEIVDTSPPKRMAVVIEFPSDRKKSA